MMAVDELELSAARAAADQGHAFYDGLLTSLISDYLNFCPEKDDQDRRSVYMVAMRQLIGPDEAVALLAIAIDRLSKKEQS
jgi:hypothetical protein